MKKPYSDKRWYDNPKPADSLCNTCQRWKGFGKCTKHKSGVPDEILDVSFPNKQEFNENYCQYRKPKKST